MLPGYLSFFCSRCIQRRMINQLVPNISNSLAIPKHFHFFIAIVRHQNFLNFASDVSRIFLSHVNFQVFLKSRPDNWFRKHMLFLEDSKVHIQLFRRFLRRFSALYWWIAYPDEFALDNFDVYVGFPESRQRVGLSHVSSVRWIRDWQFYHWGDAGSRYVLGKTWMVDADTRGEVENSMAERESPWVSRFLQFATSFHQLLWFPSFYKFTSICKSF